MQQSQATTPSNAMQTYCVYILASKPYGTLYIGVTRCLVGRVIQHRDELIEGFTKRYGVKTLVHYDVFEGIRDAIQREKSLKRWPREWKINLIERGNPQWQDLFPGLIGAPFPGVSPSGKMDPRHEA
ncbi:MAG: GIY-YIG nuclease family protein [Hyphomicrobium sp.]